MCPLSSVRADYNEIVSNVNIKPEENLLIWMIENIRTSKKLGKLNAESVINYCF